MGCIYTGVKDKNLYIIVQGRGTAEYCSELNENIQRILSEEEIEKVYIDTREACYVDSSFIGLVLSIKKKFLTQGDNRVFLLNPSDKIVDIFQIMGLDAFVPALYDSSIVCEEPNIEINKKSENSISDIKLLLESHKNIMETSSENHKRFALVEKVFQKELEQKQQYSN